MSKWENKELKGVEMYLYFISHFKMSADEAAEEMKEHGKYTDDVCLAHTMLNKHVIKQKMEQLQDKAIEWNEKIDKINKQKGKSNETTD